jgi:hypothetical protein
MVTTKQMKKNTVCKMMVPPHRTRKVRERAIPDCQRAPNRLILANLARPGPGSYAPKRRYVKRMDVLMQKTMP